MNQETLNSYYGRKLAKMQQEHVARCMKPLLRSARRMARALVDTKKWCDELEQRRVNDEWERP